MQKVNKHKLKVSWEVTLWQKAKAKDVAANAAAFIIFDITPKIGGR